MEIPVYLAAGFLDGGKTSFLNGVLGVLVEPPQAPHPVELHQHLPGAVLLLSVTCGW